MDYKTLENIFVFGDGLSDMGRLGYFTNYKYPPSPPFFEGRWTNGAVWVEYLAEMLGVKLDFSNNFAIGGATTGYYNINEPLKQSLNIDKKVVFSGLANQVEMFLAGKEAVSSKDLYVIWAGGHDIGSYLEYGEPDIIKYPPSLNIKSSILKLYIKGARKFLVGNLPDLLNTPLYANSPSKQTIKDIVNHFNSSIDNIFDSLKLLEGIEIIKLDAFNIFEQIIINHKAYGLDNITESYLPFDYIDFENPLKESKYKELFVTKNRLIEDKYMTFWGISVSNRVHKILAEKALEIINL